MAYTLQLSTCFCLSPVTVHVLLVAGALINPIRGKDMWPRLNVWQWASLGKVHYHFTTLTLTWRLFEELGSTFCGSGEKEGESRWWVRWVVGEMEHWALTRFPDALQTPYRQCKSFLQNRWDSKNSRYSEYDYLLMLEIKLISPVNICINLSLLFCAQILLCSFSIFSGFVQGVDVCMVLVIDALTLSPSCRI